MVSIGKGITMALRSALFITLATSGIGAALFVITSNRHEKPIQKVLFQPAQSPYKDFIAGQGSVEASSKNIAIGAAFNELITAIYVKPGQAVTAGQPLFKLETKHLEAQLAEAQQQKQFDQLAYENKKDTFHFYKNLFDKAATSKQAYNDALYAKRLAKATLEITQARIKRIKVDLERSISRAPCDGIVMQININTGESATTQRSDVPLMLFGSATQFHVRVEIDEDDVWRIIDKAAGTAFVRGNSKIAIPLEFVYAEPFVIPKQSLIGSTLERVDTRVKQLVYSFTPANNPIHLGQLLDVFLQAKPHQDRP